MYIYVLLKDSKNKISLRHHKMDNFTLMYRACIVSIQAYSCNAIKRVQMS